MLDLPEIPMFGPISNIKPRPKPPVIPHSHMMAWVQEQSSAQRAWDVCGQGDWMAAVIAVQDKLNSDAHKKLVQCIHKIIEPSLILVQNDPYWMRTGEEVCTSIMEYAWVNNGKCPPGDILRTTVIHGLPFVQFCRENEEEFSVKRLMDYVCQDAMYKSSAYSVCLEVCAAVSGLTRLVAKYEMSGSAGCAVHHAVRAFWRTRGESDEVWETIMRRAADTIREKFPSPPKGLGV